MKLLNLILSLALAAPLMLAGRAAAAVETFTHEEGGIEFTVPDGWKAEQEGEQFTASPPDGSIGVVFWVPEGDTFDAAADALGDELEKTIKNAKLDGEGKDGTHNGMRHASFSGSGVMGGENIIFRVDMLMAKKPVIVLTFGSPEVIKQYADEYHSLLGSIKKVK